MTLCPLLYALCLLVPEPNSILHFHLFIFCDGDFKTDQVGTQFLSPFSPPPEWGRVRVEVNLISEPNSVFHFNFLIFSNRHVKTNQVGGQFLEGMGV